MSSRFFESAISGSSRIDSIISDIIGAVVPGKSRDCDDDGGEEEEEETATKEESSFSLTTTTSGDEDESTERGGILNGDCHQGYYGQKSEFDWERGM